MFIAGKDGSPDMINAYNALAAELAAANTKIDRMLGYHVEDHNRIKALEAALQSIAVGLVPEDRVAGDGKMYMLCASRLCSIARDAIRLPAETLVDLKDPHNAHHPDRLKGPGLTAQEAKTAQGFCPECLMTGGHKLSCSKAETPHADADGHCTRCGCEFEDPKETTHECPPGFTKETK